jgi:hypothetical protein
VGKGFGCRGGKKTEHRAGHRRVDLLAFAGLRSRYYCAKHAEGRVEPAQMVCISRTDGAGIFGIHEHAQHSPQSLPDGVIGRPMDEQHAGVASCAADDDTAPKCPEDMTEALDRPPPRW